MQSETSQLDPMPAIVGRLSCYLDKLAGQVFDIEETICQALADSTESSKNTITDLQALDFLRQSLEDLALMTLLLSERDGKDLGAKGLHGVSDKLKLRTTRSLLEGKEPSIFGAEEHTLGDIDFF
ncbi:hypothetical protein [uncultured Roseobacter sp.]|uniref:hypothetical protein n=1 Tax=uncultured Roseobacter sp. TaxID=114847 RepID=UPI00261BB27F|nr:hypothetical protein [uncultured Roseobacter sp.]